jgi:hypothetical protein
MGIFWIRFFLKQGFWENVFGVSLSEALPIPQLLAKKNRFQNFRKNPNILKSVLRKLV